MPHKLPKIDKLRIQGYLTVGSFDRIIRSIKTLHNRDYDIAGLPFSLLDQLLSAQRLDEIAELAPLATFLPAAQPTLFNAILNSIAHENLTQLDQIADDPNAHNQSRTEALGWAVFLKHRANTPNLGAAVRDVFQFWDEPTPPVEIQTATKQWQALAEQYTMYNAETARNYIYKNFGTKAADDFRNLWHPALKSDIFRLYRLAQDGGVYCDADSIPQQKTKQFFSNCGSEVWASSATSVANCCVLNGLLAAPSGAKTIENMLECALRTLHENIHKNIFWIAGPAAWTLHLHETDSAINLLPAHTLKTTIFSQIDAPYKRTARNWRVYEHGLGLADETVLRALYTDRTS
jgi:hypothetical protein